MNIKLVSSVGQQKKLLKFLRLILQTIATVSFLAAPSLVQSQPASGTSRPFILVSDNDPQEYGSRWSTLVYNEAFRRLGIPFELANYPLARQTALAEEGIVDGEAGRTYQYGEAHPNLIRVEESAMSFTFGLYVGNSKVRFQRLEDLSSNGLLVEYRRGILMCERTLKQLVPPERLSDITSVEQGIKKLLAGRTDVYCDLDIYIQGVLNSPEFKEIKGVTKVLGLGKIVPTYPYLHKKHATLAPRLAAVLKQMKAEGLIETYRLQVERELGWSHK